MEEVQQHIIENSRRYLLPPHPRLIRAELEYIALGYVIAVLSQDKIIRELHRLINVYGSIFVVGAGISFETGIPLTIELEHILHFCGAKTYSELRVDENKCRIFKKVFKDVCDKKL